MWDLASGKLLRSITDAHPPGTAILHIKVPTSFSSVNSLYNYGFVFILSLLILLPKCV